MKRGSADYGASRSRPISIQPSWIGTAFVRNGTPLAKLHDDTLLEKPLEGEDKDLIVWQVLLQVGNHGTDHRAQLLRLLNDMGVKTVSQDYIFYAYDHPVTAD